MNNVGESWVISAVEKYPTVVANGYLAGNELSELLEVYMAELVGESVYEAFGNTFPILVKFIDAIDDLSIQVHPNDEWAWQKAESLGKTEMWYVMPGTAPDSAILHGWKNDTSRSEVAVASQNGSILNNIREYKLRPNDVIFIDAGTVHAIKKGAIVAEIQENSDITYRLYDYDRVGNDGKKRPLRLNDALDVLNYKASSTPAVTHADCQMNKPVQVADSPYFTTNVLTFDRTIQRDYAPLDSFVIYMCVEGEAEVEALEAEQDGTVSIRQGEAVLIPAALNDIRITPKSASAKFLEVYMA